MKLMSRVIFLALLVFAVLSISGCGESVSKTSFTKANKQLSNNSVENTDEREFSPEIATCMTDKVYNKISDSSRKIYVDYIKTQHRGGSEAADEKNDRAFQKKLTDKKFKKDFDLIFRTFYICYSAADKADK